MQIRKGMSNIQKHAEQRSAGRGNGDFIRFIRLQDDGDMVKFRLVTDSDPEYMEQSGAPHLMIEADFHRVQKTTSRNKTIWVDEICKMAFNPETEQWEGECSLCDQEISRRTQFMAWAYVYAFYYRQQHPKYVPEDPSTERFKRDKVKLGNQVVFKETVDQFCIWQDGFYMRQLVEGKIARYGTLCDRDYLVTRHGVRRSQQTQRVLEDLPPSPISAELLENAKTLPSLDDIATGKVRTYGGNTKEEKPEEVSLAEEDIPVESIDGVNSEASGAFDEIFAEYEEAASEPAEQEKAAGETVADDLPF